MEIQQFDFDESLSWGMLNISASTPNPVSLLEEIASSSSSSGWRRLKSETTSSLPNMDPLWLNENGAKITDVDEDLDNDIYEKTKNALANLGILNLGERSISNAEIDALAPLIQKIISLVTPTEDDTKAKNNEKIGLLEQLGNHSLANDSAAKNLLKKDIEELKDANNTFVCAKGKHKGTLGKIGHKVAKFWKKHKKEIIITAAVVAVAAAVVVVVAATGGTAAAGAAATGGAAGAALADSGSKEKPHPKPNPPPFTSEQSSLPTDPSTISFPFTTFDPTAFPGKMTFAETGVYCDGQFTSYDDTLFNPPSISDKSWVNNWLHSLEKIKTETIPTLPYIPSFTPQVQTTIPEVNELSGLDLNAFAYQSRGDLALSAGYYDQALQDFNKAIEIEPGNAASYLGRGAAHFELGEYDACIADYNQYTSLAPKAFSITDFSVGFAKGLPRGVYESGEGMLLFLTDLATNPIQTGSQVYQSFSTLSSLVKAGEWEAIGSALSPELHELITQWETLPDSKKGELAGYAFGKHGADILLPGGATKLVAKGSTAVKELGSVCKNLQKAEKVFVLEAMSKGSQSGIDIGKVITSAEQTLLAGEDLGLTTKQMAEFKQAGTLEQVVGKGRDYFAGQPELQASYDLFKSAQGGLKPYIKTPMPEPEIRSLIQQYGISTFDRPAGIPANYLVKITDRGAGMEYVNPTNSHLSIRVMPGKPHSPHIHQQKPYIIQMNSGKAIDKYGNLISKESPEAHLPLEEFIFRE